MAATCSVFLNVHDIEKSLAFYKGLGFKVDALHRGRGGEGPVRYADLSFQGADLGLGSIPSSDDPEFRAWVSTPLGAGVVVYFNVPDVDRIHEKARAQGAVVEYAPTDRPYGRVFALNDPDGYVLTFLKEPRRAPARKKAAKTAKTVKAAAKRAAGKTAKKARRSPAARSLDAARKQAVRKGAAKKGLGEMRKSNRGIGRVP